MKNTNKKIRFTGWVSFAMILFFALQGVVMEGCYYDNNAELHPELYLNESACDTTATISFAADIKPILSSSCGTNNSCHGQSNTSNIPLNTYDGVKTVAANNTLLNSVEWTGGASFMPKNSSAKLNDCYLAKLRTWVNDGAPNN